MKIKIYVSWDEGEILTEKEYDDFKKVKVADVLGDEYDRAEYINDYLKYEKNYDHTDLLFMEEEERKLITDCAIEYLAERVSGELAEVFKEIELEV